MNKTLRISFALKNTYRVNGILYAIKQVPLIKKLLPDTLYREHGLKVFANVISVIWEIASTFLGKLLYFATMVAGVGVLYQNPEPDRVFLHILLFLSVAGAFANTYLFNPTRDKYYAMVLMRMNARSYTLVNYGLAIVKVIVGFMPFAVLFGRMNQVSLWICLLIPFFVAGFKLIVSAASLFHYERTGEATNENKLSKLSWLGLLLLLGTAYGLPALGITIPSTAAAGIMIGVILLGLLSVWKVYTFQNYQDMYHQLLTGSMNQMDSAKKAVSQQSHKAISADTGITSKKKGFEYRNESVIKRHQEILWKASKRIAAVCLCLVLGALLAFYLFPGIKGRTNELLLTYLPYFVFIMYAINRGTGFTRALFMNCDHSLLTYSFYKQPKFILQLFQIRLREIIKVNLLPAVIIGAGLAVLLFASGGTDNVLNYAVLFVSILCMSVFFSVHYLTIYYLLQPYNAGTEIKSATYQIISVGTYLVCYFMMQLEMSTLIFGFMTIVFCVLYCIVASILVYKFAPQTFRIRS